MAKISVPNFEYEKNYNRKGYNCIVGLDEVGRGAWAGPIVAGAVVLPYEFYDFGLESEYYTILSQINDSKKIVPRKRKRLAIEIKKMARYCEIGVVTAVEIDGIGIQKANFLAFSRALSGINDADFLLIDAYKWKESDIPFEAIVKGDEISISIAAASIIAKVARDQMMIDIDNQHDSKYCFTKHKGYGTKLHVEMLKKFGVSEWHRKTYRPIRDILQYI